MSASQLKIAAVIAAGVLVGMYLGRMVGADRLLASAA